MGGAGADVRGASAAGIGGVAGHRCVRRHRAGQQALGAAEETLRRTRESAGVKPRGGGEGEEGGKEGAVCFVMGRGGDTGVSVESGCGRRFLVDVTERLPVVVYQ